MGAPSLPEFLIVISIIFGIALYILPTYLVILINIKTGIGTTYSRKKYWIWSIVLLLVLTLGAVIFQTIELFTQAGLELDSTEANTFISLAVAVASGLAILLPTALWLNALVNRIRDYGGNPWMAMWAAIPLINIILGLYCGIAKHKLKETAIENNEPFLDADQIYP